MKGVRFSKTETYSCTCTSDYVVDLWTCELSNSQNEVIEKIVSDVESKNGIRHIYIDN